MAGDFSKWGSVDTSFSQTKKAIGAVWQGAKATYNDQKGNRAWIDARMGTASGNIDFDANGKGGFGNSKTKKDKETDAEKRAKQEAEFWKTMENELELSKLTTQEAEKRRKEMELEKITGQAINAQDKDRLSTLLQQTKAAQFIQKATEDHRQKMAALDAQQEQLNARLNGATKEQLEIQKAVSEAVAEAKKQGVTLDQLQLDILKSQVTEEQRRTQEIAKRNKMLDDAVSLAEKYSLTYQGDKAKKDYQDAVEAVNYAFEHGAYGTGEAAQKIYQETLKGLKNALRDSADAFRDEMASRIDELGNALGGAFGRALSTISKILNSISQLQNNQFGGLGVLGKIADVAGIKGVDANGKLLTNKLGDGFKTGVESTLGKVFDEKTWSDPIKSISDGFKTFGSDLKSMFSEKGGFMKGLGGILGKAAGGAQLGGMVGDLLGLDSKGSNIGGALGGAAFGPIGGLVGGLVGGLLGGLFKKAPKGSAIITGVNPNDLTVSANKQNVRDNLTTAGGSIQQGVQSLADAFGVSVGGFNVSIGSYKDQYRVSGSGSASVGYKNPGNDLLYSGSSAEEAIKIAIRDAVQDGALIGVSNFTKNIVSNSADLDRAVSIAKAYEDILDQLVSFKDPVKGAVNETVKSIDILARQMKDAGATAEDLANVEQYRSEVLKKTLEQQTSGYNDLLKTLNGTTGGTGALKLLTDDMAKLQAMKNTIETGGTIDQSKFTALGQEILSYAGSIYGTQTTAFQNIRSELVSVTQQALDATTAAFNDAAGDTTATAIYEQTDAIVSQQQLTNDYLGQIAAALATGNLSVATKIAVNGQMLTFN